MAEGMFSHLINIQFHILGAQQAKQAITEVRDATRLPWDTKQAAGYEDAVRKAFGAVKTGTAVVPEAARKMGDFERAMRRALIVAPVWMALRQGMQFFITGIKEGIEYMVQFEKQALLLGQALQGVGANVGIAQVKEEIVALSKDTGKSTAEVAKNYIEMVKAIGKFAGATDAATIALHAQEVAQSNTLDITKALALAIRIQGDSFDKTSSQQKKYEEVASTLYVLSTKNLVSFEELAKEYVNFAATGDAANLTFQETAAVLATLNSAGVQNVQGLKTALLRTLADSKKVATELGIAIKPDTKPFELFIEVLNKFRGAAKGGANLELFGALGELYGKGGRGGSTIIKILSDTIGQLNANLKETEFPTRNTEKFNEALENTQKSLPHQIELLQNLKRQAFETFIIGVTGGKDFADGIKNLNAGLEAIIPNIKAFGDYWRLLGKGIDYLIPVKGLQDMNKDIGEAMKKGATEKLGEQTGLYDRILKAMKGELTIQETVRVLMEAKSSKLIQDEALRGRIVTQLETEARLLTAGRNTEEEKNKAAEQTTITLQKQTKELEKQKSMQEDLILQYAKATPEEKPALKRKLELSQMSESSQIFAFSTSKEDRAMLLEMASKLTEAVRDVMAGKLAMEEGLYTNLPTSLPTTPVPSPITQNVTAYGAKEIAINMDMSGTAMPSPEEMVTLMTNEMGKALLANEEFVKSLSRKTIKVMPEQ